MEPAEAFNVGYLTAMVGVPLRGVELMNLVGKSASGGLATAVDAQVEGFRAHNDGTVQNVLRVESILERHGLSKAQRPQTADSWVHWADHNAQIAGGAAKSDSPAAAALLAGSYYGDLLAAVQLEQILVGLKADAPDDKELAAQIAGHAKHAADAVAKLEQVLRHPALSANAKAPLEAVVEAYRGAGEPTHESLAALKTAINAQGKALSSAF